MDRLIVKNFGPLKDIDIELNKINLFIGENGSGKSVLAKLITILLDYEELSDKKFINDLKYYNINFLNENTEIKFLIENENIFEYINGKIVYNNLINTLEVTLKPIKEEIKNIIYNIKDRDNLPVDELKKIIYVAKEYKVIGEDKLSNLETYIRTLEKLKSQYLPAERNLISVLNKSLSSLIISDIPLPKFLLKFASEYEKARDEIKELSFLNVRYENSDIDRIYYNKENYLTLEQSSSGIQSALPMFLTTKYFAQKYRTIVIEEPEQNLFPEAQVEAVKFIIEQIDRNNLFLMTHSPYVLSTLNILMMAHKVGSLSSKASKEVEKIIPKSKWLNRDNFSAYYIEDGKAKNIKGKTGLISENVIDDISDEIDSEFQELLELYREFKNDK